MYNTCRANICGQQHLWRKVGWNVLDEQAVLFSALPASSGQKRLAFIVALFLLVALLLTFPFMGVQLERLDAFIPIVDTVLFLGDLIAAVLLFAQFSVLRSRALFALACGYLYTALIIVPHGLTFPGAFAYAGLPEAGLQTTVWLSIFSHLGLPSAVIAYSLLKRTEPTTASARGPAGRVILVGVAVITSLVFTLTWLVTADMEMMPTVMVDALHANTGWLFAGRFLVLLSITAGLLLWIQQRSLLDLWLLMVVWALLIETILLTITLYRFGLVWYAARVYGLLSTSFVLLVLLSEVTTLYARLALFVMAQRSEREGQLMTLDTLMASIAHEISQPLTAITVNGNATLRYLAQATPDLDEARAAVSDIVNDGHRASQIIRSIRAMFKKDAREKLRLDVNAVIREALALSSSELQHQQIVVQTELQQRLPNVIADRLQLQQVLLNLIMNAVEAMNPAAGSERRLLIRSHRHERDGVVITVEDSGIGIDPKNKDRIFDAFFTTKSNGTGMGLAICRSFVEAHGGRMWASPRLPHGANFHVILPHTGAATTL